MLEILRLKMKKKKDAPTKKSIPIASRTYRMLQQL